MPLFDCICENCKKVFQVKYKCRQRRFCSKSCAAIGENNPAWLADNVGIVQVHAWIKKNFQKPDKCEKCGSKTKLDLANKSNLYKRDRSDWDWLCRKCHMESDGRLERFLSHSAKKRIPNRNCNQCGVEYWPFTRYSLFCSKSCRMRHYNLNIKKYARKD